DWGDGPGHMQPRRGHRHNILDPKMKLAGLAALPHSSGSNTICVTYNFGTDKQRWLGGVVLDDRNRNRFYDIGEGVGGIPLMVGEQKQVSWASGGFAMPIPQEAAKLVVELSGKKYATFLPAGKDNVKFDIFVSDKAVFARNAEQLQSFKKIPETEQ